MTKVETKFRFCDVHALCESQPPTDAQQLVSELTWRASRRFLSELQLH